MTRRRARSSQALASLQRPLTRRSAREGRSAAGHGRRAAAGGRAGTDGALGSRTARGRRGALRAPAVPAGARCSACPAKGRADAEHRQARRRFVLRAPAQVVRARSRRTRTSSPSPEASGCGASHYGRSVDEPATSAAILRAALSPTRRVARLVAERTPPKLTTAEAKKLGHQADRRHVHDDLRRHREPHPQRAARRAPDRQPLHPPGRGVLVQQDDRRARRGEGLSRGAGDHQRRAADRPRRRRLPGVDDGLQRRLRGRI